MNTRDSFLLTLWLFTQLDFMLFSFGASFILFGIRVAVRNSRWVLVGMLSIVWLLLPISVSWTSLLITSIVWTIQVSYDVYVKNVDPDVPEIIWKIARWSRKIKIR